MSRRAATKKANREELVAAARQVFATVGYEACTVRDIARASSLASGSFYNYFVDTRSQTHVHGDTIEISALR